MVYFYIYIALGAFVWAMVNLTPLKLGKTAEVMEINPLAPFVFFLTLCFWPLAVAIGLTLQVLAIEPERKNPRNSDESASRAEDAEPVDVPGRMERARKSAERIGYAYCSTDLNPSGKIRMGDETFLATSRDSYINAGERVAVVRNNGDQFVVERGEK